MLTSIKAKFVPVLNKLKLLTNKSFIQNKLIVRIRSFFFKLFDVRPKNEKDYYLFLGWMVSRKLAMALTVTITVLCIGILWSSKPDKLQSESTYRTYKYNSILLKGATGNVEILGKSGYTAYVGEVENGTVKGNGTLYSPEGNIVYEGEFDANAYNGTGKYYYENSQLRYEGKFKDNKYDGEGKLYRENGTLKYEGEFSQGCMAGEGKLYDAAQKEIFNGNFQNDQVIYQEFIGKKTTDVTQMYTGVREVYIGDEVYLVYMKDIDALYFGEDRSNSLDEDFLVSGVYVLKSEISLEGDFVSEISQLQKYLGNPVYEGNTYLEPKDEIALNKSCELMGKDILYGKSGYKTNAIYDDVMETSDFDKTYQVYIYVYEKDEIVYTFFCKDKGQGFDFYMMEK